MKNKQKLKSKLLSRVTPDKDTGCWIYNKTDDFKYGRFTLNSVHFLAHRASHLLFKGDIPQGYDVDHFYCNNNYCVNPGHLEAVTHAVNIRRAADRGVYRGDRNPNAKHSNVIVEQIKNMAKAGKSKRELSKIFDVPYSTVCGILRGHSRTKG